MFVIFDLDGTLANDSHRKHFLEQEPKNWLSYFEACDKDGLNVPILTIAQNLLASNWIRVEIWTGRSDRVIDKTKAWLRKVGLGDVTLKMRDDEDRRPDNELKQEWLQACTRKPDLVFEDRDRVVKMWRRNGITCAQVAPGNF